MPRQARASAGSSRRSSSPAPARPRIGIASGSTNTIGGRESDARHGGLPRRVRCGLPATPATRLRPHAGAAEILQHGFATHLEALVAARVRVEALARRERPIIFVDRV